MRYPSFYYKKKHGKAIYNNTSKGHFSARQFARGLPAFRQLALGFELEPKSLILADWTATDWDNSKIKSVQTLLEQLIHDGFKLYIKQWDDIIPLTLENMPLLEASVVRNKMTPDAPQNIRKKASDQLRLPDDQLHILDDYWLTNLLTHQPKPGNRELSIQALHNFNASQIVNTFKNAVPRLEAIIHDEFSDKANQTLQFIQSEIPETPVKHEYKSLELNSEQITALTEEPHEVISKNGISLDTSQLLNVENLTLKEGNLNALITPHLPALRELNLSGYEGRIAQTVNLSNLERLILYDAQITFSDLAFLLAGTSQLKQLDVSKCTQLRFIEDTECVFKLGKLEELFANGTPLSPTLLWYLIEGSPHLKVLDLSKNSSYEEELPTNEYALTKLKKLIVSDTFLEFELIMQLLAQAYQLEHLDLSKNDFTQDEITNRSLKLERLKTLKLNGSAINLSDFQKLIAKAFDLETLDLNSCTLEFDTVDLELNLSKLRVLDLSSSKLKHSELNYFCSQLVQRNSEDFESSTGTNYDSLKELNLSDTKISKDILISLLPRTRGLEKLDLSKCSKLTEEFPEMDLSSLIELDISNTPINTTSLLNLLRHAKNLKQLNIQNCPNISFSREDINLPSLETLIMSRKDARDTTIKNLIAKLPPLKAIHLSNLISFITLFDSTINLEQLETLTIELDSVHLMDLIQLVNKTPKLSTLYFKNDECHFSLGQDNILLENIKSIYLSGSQFIGGNILALLTITPNLEILDLSSCSNFTIPDGATLSLPQLRSLNLKGSKINAETLKKILSAAPNLQELNLENTAELYIDETLKELMKTLSVTSGIPNSAEPSETSPIAGFGVTNTAKLDADTTLDPEKTYNIKRLFYPITPEKDELPPPESYRIESFDRLTINSDPCAMADAFMLSNEEASQLSECSIEFSKDVFKIGKKLASTDWESAYFQSPQTMRIGPQWTSIASLKPWEQITHYQINPACSVEFAYSERDKMYYVRSLTENDRVVDLEFLVKIPKLEHEPLLPEDIDDIVNYIKKFTAGELNLEAHENPTGYDYLYCIIDQRKGACRHRAAAFKAWMNQIHPEIPIKIINNQCHTFIEFEIDGYRLKRDLGGYPARLIIQEKDQQLTSPPSLLDQEPANTTQKFYRALLKTWKRQRVEQESVAAACKRLTHPLSSKRQLIELEATADLQAMQLSLQSYCQHRSKRFFSINSSEDLFFVSNEETEGDLKSASVGPLQRFLEQSQATQTSPVIVINYENLDADDCVKLNDFLDKEGKHIQVLGLINIKKPEYYEGSDLYSRFDRVERCSLPSASLASYEQKKAPLPLAEHSDHEDTYPIDFYHSPDWKELLLGHLEIKKGEFVFSPGELSRALASHLPIELKNAPWEDESFALFWKQAYLSGVVEDVDGNEIEIPQSLSLRSGDGYSWADLTEDIKWERSNLSLPYPELNPGNFSDFFKRYEYDDEHKTMDTIPGYIEAHARTNLTVHLTRELALDQWARLLSHCQQHEVQLTVCCAPKVTIPEELLPLNLSQVLTNQDDFIPKFTAQVVTDDPDTAISHICSQSDWLVLDISECSSDDLLIHTHGEMNKETNKPRFEQSQRVLLNAFDQGKNVILKGEFSDELVDSLTAFILKRDRNPDKNTQLVLVSDRPRFTGLQSNIYTVEVAKKTSCLLREFAQEEIALLNNNLLETESLSRLRARLTHHRIAPEEPLDNAWRGIYDLPGGIDLKVFDPEHSAERAHAFNQERYNRFMNHIAHSPFVCATGLTGTGKSTFFESYFNTDTTELYKGEAQKKQWAEDHTDKLKILFFDEANLSPRQWSEFEGLFNIPPGILIDGHYYPLTDNHKVAFVSNPLSYGGERQLAPFFERHGGAMVFEPLSMEFIYEEILKPVFKNTPLQDSCAELSKPILEMYAFLCNCSKTEVLISPRELQMMALLILSTSQQARSPEQMMENAHHYVYQLALGLVPEANKAQLEHHFRPHFQWNRASRGEQLTPDRAGFLITESRREMAQLVTDFLQLRTFQRQVSGNEAQLYGGLGGIIVEGLPGIGKTEILAALLIYNGYQEIHYKPDLAKESVLPEKGFYRIPSNIPEEEKSARILKAFMAGHGIVIDEINSSPMLELELNAMLMGKTLDGKRPDKPGFFMFGTQNPITMAGRRATSTAIKRRVITINLPEYTSAEMVTILCNKGLAKELASQLVLAYEHNVNRAQKEHLTPVPTFRDLLRVSKSFLRDEQRGIKRKEREDDKEYRRDKKKDKGKEKEKEKEKEEELLFSGDKAYYYKELKSLLEKHLNYAKSQDRFFASWEDRSEISIINKILVFLETNTTIPEINPGELEAINNAQQLGNLMSEMVRNGFLDGSGLQWNGLEIELSNTNITGLRNMDF